MLAMAQRIDTTHLEKNELMLGSTTVKIRFENYKTADSTFCSKFKCKVNNPIDNIIKYVNSKLSDNKEMVFDLPLTTKHQTIMVYNDDTFWKQSVLTTKDSVQTIVLDLQKYHKDKKSGFYYFQGANSDVNNAILKNFGQNISIIDYKIKLDNAKSYKEYVLNSAEKIYKRIDESDMPLRAKEYAKIITRGNSLELITDIFF